MQSRLYWLYRGLSIAVVALLASFWVAQPAGAKTACFGVAATIVGTAGNNVIYGGPGDDVIYGDAGDDVIYVGERSISSRCARDPSLPGTLWVQGDRTQYPFPKPYAVKVTL